MILKFNYSIFEIITHQMILLKAQPTDLPTIWIIMQQAIEQRRLEGSKQWQQGYPNEKTIYDDIFSGFGFVLTENGIILAYVALIFGTEPAYNVIDGSWITTGDYAVVHRVATSNAAKNKGVATQLFIEIEKEVLKNKYFSIRVDTNFDNIPMLKILKNWTIRIAAKFFCRAQPEWLLKKF